MTREDCLALPFGEMTQQDVAGNAWDIGRLTGMLELARRIIGFLCSAEFENAEVERAFRELADAFDWEIICRGDIIPEEFEDCFVDALRKVGDKSRDNRSAGER